MDMCLLGTDIWIGEGQGKLDLSPMEVKGEWQAGMILGLFTLLLGWDLLNVCCFCFLLKLQGLFPLESNRIWPRVRDSFSVKDVLNGSLLVSWCLALQDGPLALAEKGFQYASTGGSEDGSQPLLPMFQQPPNCRSKVWVRWKTGAHFLSWICMDHSVGVVFHLDGNFLGVVGKAMVP